MKNKLTCLLIAIAMLAGLSACSGDSSDISSSATYNMTLTLWLPTSKNTKEADVLRVQNAINSITKKSINTAIEIHAVPDDEYEEAVREKLQEVEAAKKKKDEEEAERKRQEREAKKRGETLAPVTTETAFADDLGTVTAENGEIETAYPAVTSSQFDIFCMRGYDEFMYYADNGYLEPLDESLDASSKLLKSYIYPTFLQAGMSYGSTFAIPNNHVIGKYTYMLINKKLCESLSYDESEFTTLLDAKEFIEDVGASTNVTPLLNEVYASGIRFWNASGDPDAFSVLGTYVSDDGDPNARHNIRNIFGLKQFNNTFIMMKELREKGYIAANPDNVTEFGVGVVSCDGNEISKYADDYYVKVIERPRAETDDVYRSMFGVSTFTNDVSRSMQIITLINTNSTIRTLLQYGVEGVHWEYNDELTESGEKTIRIISDDYQMNLEETGNVFITYPGENLPMSYWETGKQQNLDSLASPFLGFTNYITEENKDRFDALDTYSAQILDRINAMTAEEYAEVVSDLQDEVSESDAYNDMADSKDEKSLISAYLSFFADKSKS